MTCRIRCTTSRSLCICFGGRIKILDMHTIQMPPNAIKIIAMKSRKAWVFVPLLHNVVCAHTSNAWLFKIARWITAINASVLRPWVCCMTSHVIVQHDNIIAQFITLDLLCFATSITMYKYIFVYLTKMRRSNIWKKIITFWRKVNHNIRKKWAIYLCMSSILWPLCCQW